MRAVMRGSPGRGLPFHRSFSSLPCSLKHCREFLELRPFCKGFSRPPFGCSAPPGHRRNLVPLRPSTWALLLAMPIRKFSSFLMTGPTPALMMTFGGREGVRDLPSYSFSPPVLQLVVVRLLHLVREVLLLDLELDEPRPLRLLHRGRPFDSVVRRTPCLVNRQRGSSFTADNLSRGDSGYLYAPIP